MVLTGPAGIGKTTLAKRTLAGQTPAMVSGYASLQSAPMTVFQRMLNGRVRDDPERVAADVLNQGRESLLLDDLQWADDLSLAVIPHLVGRVPMIATVRTGDDRAEFALACLSLVGAITADVPPLSCAEADALAERIHPNLSDVHRRRIVAAASGNPLLIEELGRPSDGSPTLVSALAPRVDALSAPARQALDRLLVLGRPASAELIGAGTAEVLTSGLATDVDGQVMIRHPLLGAVLLEQLGPRADNLRRELAERVDALEAAYLLEAAGAFADARAHARATAAAAEPRDRAGLLAVAIRCAPDPRTVDLDERVTAARLASATGQFNLARELVAVDDLEDRPRFERGVLRAVAAETAWYERKIGECIDLIRTALPDLRGTRSRYEVLALAGSAVDGAGDAEDRAREALGLALEIDEEVAYAESRLATVLYRGGNPEGKRLSRSAVARAQAKGDVDLVDQIQLGLVIWLAMTGERAAAEATAREAAANYAEDTADLRPAQLSLLAAGLLMQLLGGRDRRTVIAACVPLLAVPVHRGRALSEAVASLALADLGRHEAAAEQVHGAVERAGLDPSLRAAALWARADVAWLAGRLEEARNLLPELEGLGIDNQHFVIMGRLATGHAAVELGCRPPGMEPVPAFPGMAASPIEWEALNAAAAGDSDRAVERAIEAARLWARCDQRSEARCWWAAGDWAAQAGRDDALDLLERAEATAMRVGMDALEPRLRRSLRRAGVHRSAPTSVPLGGLSGREVEVLTLVATGRRTIEAATTLGVETSTVDSVLRSAMRKLEAPTRLAAVARLNDLRLTAQDA